MDKCLAETMIMAQKSGEDLLGSISKRRFDRQHRLRVECDFPGYIWRAEAGTCLYCIIPEKLFGRN
jgi:hypothetical protein